MARRVAAFLSAAALLLAVPALAQGLDAPVYTTPIASTWQGDATRGPVVYKPLGIAFPERLGKFERFRVSGFEGLPDFWVNYDWKRPAGNARLTVFLFKPRASMAEHTIAGSINSFGQANGSELTFVWSDGPRNIATPERELRFFKGTYKTGIGPGTVLDYIYFADLGTWRVKVRVTLPSSSDPTDEAEIEAAIAALDWKAILAGNGACSGPACTTDGPAVFNNHMGEMFLTKVINSGQGKKLSGDASKPLFQRKVEGTEWEVFPLDPRINELFAKGYGALSLAPTTYSLSWHKGGKSGIVRFFSGEPSEAMFNREVERLTKRPETTIFVPMSDAAFHAAD